MSRLSIRLKLTLVFSSAMALVFGLAGFLLYQHLAASLDRTLDQGLRARAADVSALIEQADTGLSQSSSAAGADNGFAQVLTAGGRIFDQTPGLGPHALLPAGLRRQAMRAPLWVGRTTLAGRDVRLLALPITAQDRRLVVVVGAPLAVRDDALAGLRSELLISGPLTLLLTSLVGYLVAAAALRPVDRMRTRAATISAQRLSERLPVPASGDELARLGDTLNELLARVETALECERSFTADASHELRTPLTLLKAEIELALESPRSKQELEAALRSAGEETDRLSQLAEDLLLLARLDRGALPLRIQPTDLRELLTGVAARFERRARETGRTIEVESGDLRVDVDRIRLEQALANLVENALRHGAGPIRLAAVQRDELMELHVTDHGPGFPTDFLPHAFERFSRADDSRGSGGSGLGLAIVAAVVAAHGGTVSATNTPRGGAEVALTVPVSSFSRRSRLPGSRAKRVPA